MQIKEERENKEILEKAARHFDENVLPVLEQEFKGHENNHDILLHSVKSGKRLRPFYCNLAFNIGGGSGNPDVHFASAAMELIHCSSLLIDDELDKKEMRPDRNVDTVRKVFSPEEAVFMGACLELLYTYDLLVKASRDIPCQRRQQVLETFAASYSEGVTKEIEKWKHIENRAIITKDDYWNRHLHSSGGLFFRMSGRIGALLATDDTEMIDKLSDIGYQLGLILQAGDDIKDLKPDMKQGYYSLAVIEYLETLSSDERIFFRNRLAGGLSDEDVEEVYQKMIGAGSIDRSLAEIKRRGDHITGLIKDLPESESRQEAADLIDFLASRMRLI